MTNVILVGSGLTGGTLAYALAQKGIDVALVDQIDPRLPILSDGRSFALSRSSYNIFSKLGMWPKEVTPITTIHTSDGVLLHAIDYHQDDVKGGPLGYVVDSASLKSQIAEKILSHKNIHLHVPSSVVRFERTETHTLIETDQKEILKAPLCIAADGKFSTVRTWAQIPLLRWPYDQIAIVCNVAHTLPHHYHAFEHFLPSGPLAFVPRPGQESGLVWSVEKEKADVLLSLSEQEFAEEIQALFGSSLGAFTLSSPRRGFPLDVCLPKRLIDHRLALVGDAAHIFHPVAGQGLNVGLRDVATLAEVVEEAFSLGLDLGSSSVLNRYQKRRRMDILSMTLLTDGIVRIFSNQSPTLAHARSIGFGMAKHLTPLKHFMIRHAMGVTGRVPYLAKDE